ncbi:MAG: glycoside hydrolase family 1 protein [Myxococcales bacterium]|nr:glycoside hydrolase family 1 protein [Myxococcales bacterium]
MARTNTLQGLLAAGLAAAALAPGCKKGGFGEDFAFGAAVAGFQVDMGCPTIPAEECEDRGSDWYQFVTSTVAQARSSNFLSGDPVGRGPGFYELYEEDLDRAQALGLTHFRFSVEWSRVFPTTTRGVEGHEALLAVASPAGLDYYRRIVAALKARGMRPLVTLHHYTLPAWIHDAVGCNQDLTRCRPRGWLEPDIATELAKYAGFMAKELGPEVDEWVTENEPFAVVLPGFLQPTETRTNPPAASLRFEEARTAMLAMIYAHAAMSDAVKAADTVDADGDGEAARVGIVYNVTPIHAKDPDSALDRRAATNIDHLYNGLFLDAVLLGVLDDDLDGVGEPQARLQGKTDFLGVNYYTRVVLQGTIDSLFPDFSPLATFDPLTLEQGAVYPEGMYEVLTRLQADYPGVPLVITENGVDVGAYPETDRFLAAHLQQVLRAKDEGVDVRGYYYWSLMDNYEWNHGMGMRFGLFSVDPDAPAKTRAARPVVEAYRRVIEARDVPADLAVE